MADELIKKFLHLSGSSRSQRSSESDEDRIKRLIQEHLASQEPQASASGMNPDDLQSLLKVMKFQVDHALAEKSELAVEKVKRLQAEREAEELKRQLSEMKKNDTKDQAKVNSLEKQLQDLELDKLMNNGEEVQKLIRMLLSKESGGQNASNQKPETKSEKSGKGYDDPPWFPGSSSANDLFNHSSGFSRENGLNGAPPASAPPLYETLFPNGQNAGTFSGHGPFPPNQLPNMQHPYPNMPPPYGNMSNFQRPQFPFDGRNMPPPQYNQQFFGPMPTSQGFNSQQQQYFNPSQQPFHRPNFTQGPDQVRFTGKNQQAKNKSQKQSQPSPKNNQQQSQKGEPKQPKQQQQQQQKVDQPKQPKQQQQKVEQPKQPKQQQQQKGDQPKPSQPQKGDQPKQPKQQKSEQQKQSQPQKGEQPKQSPKVDQQNNLSEDKPDNQSSENVGETPKKTRTRRKKSKQTNNQEVDDNNVGEDVQDNSNPDSINLSETDIKNVKKAINTKKKNEDQSKPGARTTFKKKKNPKNNSGANAEGNAESDSNSNEDNESSPQQGDSQNSGAAQEIGGAKKKDASAKKAKAPKSQKTNEKEKADAKSPSSPTGDINLFVGEQIPTMKDVESGRVKLTQEVKGVVLIAKDGDNTVTETPKVVQDMILFQKKYPNAKLIICR